MDGEQALTMDLDWLELYQKITVKEGDIIIKEFLRDIAQTPNIESMNYNSILDRIQEVKGKYQEKIEGTHGAAML
ncbi:43071_t:CDS:2, partial [Gigaspora margarita]